MRRNNPSKRSQKQAEKPLASQLTNMVTMQEQHMMEIETIESDRKNKAKVSFIDLSYNQEQQQQQVQYSIQQLKQSSSDKISTLISQLLAKNKINSKNAFQVPLIHLNETNAYQEASSDNSWKKLSSALESNNKIYGYRVDATHNQTYRVLQSFTRQEKKNQEKVKDEIKAQRYQINSLNTKFICNQAQEIYGKYLEKNYRNINIIHLETFFNVNPVLEKTKRIFDQQGLKGLLLNNLDIKQDLSIKITLNQKCDQHQVHQHQHQFFQFEDHYFQINFEGKNIFKSVEIFCKKNDIIQSDSKGIVKREISQLEQLWNIYQQQTIKQQKTKQNQVHKLQIEFEQPNKIQNSMEEINQEQIKTPMQSEIIKQQVEMPIISIIKPIALTKELQYSQFQTNEQNLFIKNEKYSKQQALYNNFDPLIAQSGKTQKDIERANIQRPLKSEEVQQPPVPFQPERKQIQNEAFSFSRNPQIILPIEQAISNHSNQNSYENSSNIFTLQKTEQQQKNEIQRNYFVLPSKMSFSTDLILRQINDYQVEVAEKVDVVSQWKKSSSRVTEKNPRVKKEVILPPPIEFLDMDDGVSIKKKNLIMNLDKSRKMDLKRLLKQIKLKPYSEFNHVINTSKWKLHLDEKTYLRQFYDQHSKSVIIMSQQPIENSSHCPKDNSIVQIVDSKQHPNFIKTCSIKQSKQKLRSIIMEKDTGEISFEDIYSIFIEREGLISPALCFLTMLHLTNQYNYELLQREGDYNFTLIKNL